jgi:DNA repair protein RAD50
MRPLVKFRRQPRVGKLSFMILKLLGNERLKHKLSSGIDFVKDLSLNAFRFRSLNQKPIVITRSMQCSQKASKLEFKTLEGALQTYNQNGEKVSQSLRCADIDKEIPELMGVSKPILENVIFCHQEDSSWPLGEPAILKKKFDDIFAATRYTKALESIKKEKKDQMILLKNYSLELKAIEANRNQSLRVK